MKIESKENKNIGIFNKFDDVDLRGYSDAIKIIWDVKNKFFEWKIWFTTFFKP